jgi:hypothetical protein
MLQEELGRMFRVALRDGLDLRVNDEQVQFIDPIRIVPGPGIGDVELLPPLEFDIAVPNANTTGKIRVQFSQLPAEEWTQLPIDAKRRFRIVNRAGVSVLRAGREIAYGWHFLGNKRKENYDDWWRCEVAFEPVLDEYFGVTHSKQGIRPTAQLINILAPTIEAQARALNRQTRRRFELAKKGPGRAERKAAARHARLTTPSGKLNAGEACEEIIRGVRYRLLFAQSDERSFARTLARKSVVHVTVNELHPFFTKIYLPLSAQSRVAHDRLNCFLLALGRTMAVEKNPKEMSVIADFLDRWSDAASLLLES